MFVGFVTLDSALKFLWLTKNSSSVPTASSTTPIYRIYGASGLMTNGTGSLTDKDTGVVTGATNATPIVITSAAHGLTTGMRVTVASVGGNTAANGAWTITRVNADTFSLDTSVGNGAYTSGGTWKATGLYEMSVTPTAANGYARGGSYDVILYATVTSVIGERFRFCVN
jgi:hypothetical protein